jgi:hypothetical protein
MSIVNLTKVTLTGSTVVEEMNSSPQIMANRTSQSITRELKLAWDSIGTLINECFPAPPDVPGVHPLASFLYVEELEFAPFHPDAGEEVVDFGGGAQNQYLLAKCKVKYGPLPYDPTTLLTRKFSVGGEVMTYPSASIRWVGEVTTISGDGISAGKILPSVDHSITFHRVVTPPYEDIRDLVGKVNESEFEDVAEECLLFLGAEMSFVFTTTGQEMWTVDYKFQERLVQALGIQLGWNYFWREDLGIWAKLETKNGDPIYPSGDFTPLFA